MLDNLSKYWSPSSSHEYRTVIQESEEDDTADIKSANTIVASPAASTITVTSLLLNLGFAITLVVYSLRHGVGSDRSDHEHGYKFRQLNPAVKMTAAYSPILDNLDLNLHLKVFEGALRDNASIWRQPPSPEVDAAWDFISMEGIEVTTVSSSDVALSGKDPSKCVKAPGSWNEGDDSYIAQIEVFHQIHCLNELRKEMFHDYYYKTPADELHRNHKAHCLHMILQALMCSADIGIVTHNWVHNERIKDPKTRPMADFNVVKKCKDFDRLHKWARETAVEDLARKWPELRWEEGMAIVPGEGYAK